MNRQDAVNKFEEIHGKTESELGFHLNVKIHKTGFIIEKWYSPNVWRDELENKVLFLNGIVYENDKQISTY